MSPSWVLNLILAVALVLSSLGVVYAKHESRRLFGELQALEVDRDRMNTEWGQLQLEQGTLTTHGQVEHAARTRLGMVIPDHGQVVMVRP
jgi:cell division protein FtsL